MPWLLFHHSGLKLALGIFHPAGWMKKMDTIPPITHFEVDGVILPTVSYSDSGEAIEPAALTERKFSSSAVVQKISRSAFEQSTHGAKFGCSLLNQLNFEPSVGSLTT